MRKTMMTMAVAACITAASVAAPTKAQARCYGCWAGAAVAAGVIGSAIIANNAYGYGYYGGYGGYGYGYAPAYGYGYASTYYAPTYYAPAYYGYAAPVYYAPYYYNPRRVYGYYGPRRVYVRSYYRPYW